MNLSDVPFILGMMRLPDYDELSDPRALARWIEDQVSRGYHVFDHADIYGAGICERLFGDAIRQAPALRDRIQVITKADIVTADADTSVFSVKHYDTTRAYLMRQAEQSLRRLGLERIDLFLIHRPDPLMPAEETARALEDLVAQGKVKAVGVSNFLPEQWRWLQANLAVPLVCNQVELSLTANDWLTDGTLEAHLRDGLRVLAWSPLSGGRWNDRLRALMGRIAANHGVSPEAVALAWIRRIPGSPVPVVGSCSAGRLAACRDVERLSLDRAQWFALLEAARGQRVP
ncbi:aldo/keto reductase [Hahella sp. SMD15-11]|uniref:Aldo/keto reductase n=1 Tax=Thermohahella caldifontis TaxID=3142973 RepID=A0AB39UTY9_9GAMM